MIQPNTTKLSDDEIIKSGSFYTNESLVNIVFNKVSQYIDSNTIIADFGCGNGAFVDMFIKRGKRFFATENNKNIIPDLKNKWPEIDVFCENSLVDINRKKYNISLTDKLLIVGNPPYNDVTSIFRKGEKGDITCDSDVLSRDYGISFLKAYAKLKADVICILHPLSYLIKKQNFSSLSYFKDNYKLVSATVFSSKEFSTIKKNNSDFPVIAALYVRNATGMNYDYIRSFPFEIYRESNKFILNKIQTIDGIIDKYPKKGENNGLQFYTLRDMNALLRNKSFIENKLINGVAVTYHNFYQYAWLFYLKENFNPRKNKFLYGNLSPIYSDKLSENKFQNALIWYAYNKNELVKKYFTKENLTKFYGSSANNFDILKQEIDIINNLIS